MEEEDLPLVSLIRTRDLEEQADAGRGRPDAMFALGERYREGRGAARDLKAAAGWFRLAADKGHLNAQAAYAVMLDQGEGVGSDSVTAARYFRLAADQGDRESQYQLGTRYEKGRGVARNPVKAAWFYRLAGDRGHCAAQARLAVMLDRGKGITSDPAQAWEWYGQAARQGDTASLLRYREMAGEEIRRLTGIAKSGNVQARIQLAEFYEEGLGTEADLIRAYMWRQLAVRAGSVESRRLLDSLSAQMSSRQLAAATRHVKSWVMEHEPETDVP